jgi:hypothetical protein
LPFLTLPHLINHVYFAVHCPRLQPTRNVPFILKTKSYFGRALRSR